MKEERKNQEILRRSRGRDVLHIASLAFTESGRALARRVKETCRRVPGREIIWKNVEDIDEEMFRISDAVFFFCAAGIAVRKIAPFLQDKTSDPAVLVIGEDGKYVISLLSGHLGGANAWAEEAAKALRAQPVITTASDVRRIPAIDVWASECGLTIGDMKAAKRIAAYLLSRVNPETQGEQKSDGPGNDSPGSGFTGQKKMRTEEAEYRICITENPGFACGENMLILRPKRYVVGVGCRRGTEPEAMGAFLVDFLRENGIDPALVERICSIDRKKDEDAIKAAARMLKAPFTVFSAEELAAVPGHFSASDFVLETAGVDNVCERAAVLGAGEGSRLAVKKTAAGGMTAAAALRSPAEQRNLMMTPEEWLARVSDGGFPEWKQRRAED